MRNTPKAERWLAEQARLVTIGGVTIGHQEWQYKPAPKTGEPQLKLVFVAEPGVRGDLVWDSPWKVFSVSTGEIRFADGTTGHPYRNVMYHHTIIRIKFVRLRHVDASSDCR